jgi:hypothetical protein
VPRIKLSPAQLAAVEVYVTDPAHTEYPADKAARLFQAAQDGAWLDFPAELADVLAERVNEASNSADDEAHGGGAAGRSGEDRRMAGIAARSLAALSGRIRKSVA